MIQVFATLYENEGLAQEVDVERAEQIFGSLDSNNDGDITEAEFVAGCMEDEEMVKMLSESSSEPPLVRDVSSGSTPTCVMALQQSSAALIANTLKIANILDSK